MTRRIMNISALLVAVLLQSTIHSFAAAGTQIGEKEMRYKAKCAVCQGQAKRGQSAAMIQNGIRKNTGGMGSLRFLSSKQIQDIANF